MRSYATISQLSDRLRQEISEDDEPSAQFALDAATAAIDSYLGQSLWAEAGAIYYINSTGVDSLVLPAMPVTINTITVDGTELVEDEDYTYDPDRGLVFGLSYNFGVVGDKRNIEVDCDTGFDEIPVAVQSVCLSLAARIYSNSTNMRSESIAGYSVTYAEVSHGLITAEMAMLNQWKIADLA